MASDVQQLLALIIIIAFIGFFIFMAVLNKKFKK